MEKIKILTDSSITIEKELIEKYDITVVPLSVMIDGKLYSDNDLKEEGQFLKLMQNSKELPKTSPFSNNFNWESLAPDAMLSPVRS